MTKTEIWNLEKILSLKEKLLCRFKEKVNNKLADFRKLTAKARKSNKNSKLIGEVEKLSNELKQERARNKELEKKLKNLEKHSRPLAMESEMHENAVAFNGHSIGNNGIESLKQKYPAFPKTQLERIEIQRTIARSMVNSNGGTFYISQILKQIEDMYPKHVRPQNRITLLNEIKSWIERDPLCKPVKSNSEVKHYTFI